MFVSRGTRWSADGDARGVSVLVHDPEPSAGHAVLDLERGRDRHGDRRAAQFLLGATPEVGCASVTQFVGLIPPGRAPDHFHKYDEVIYVLEGEGELVIDGEKAPLRAGLVHPPAARARPLPREHRRLGDARARRLPPGGLARGGLLPRRHPRRRPHRRRVSVPRIERSAEIEWEGNVARGAGRSAATRARSPSLPFSLPTRIGAAEGKTSPEELLAAAHGGCLTMSLAQRADARQDAAARLDVHCRIVMDEVEGEGHQIVASHVTVHAEVEGASTRRSRRRSSAPTRAARSRRC